MVQPAKDIVRAAIQLPENERVLVVEQLLTSLEPRHPMKTWMQHGRLKLSGDRARSRRAQFVSSLGRRYGPEPESGFVVRTRVVFPLNSAKSHIVLRKWETDDLLDAVAMLGNLLQAFIDWRIEILLLTSSTHPGWYVIHIDRLSFEMKPGSDHTMLYFACAKFAPITLCSFCHLFLFLFHISCDNQQHGG